MLSYEFGPESTPTRVGWLRIHDPGYGVWDPDEPTFARIYIYDSDYNNQRTIRVGRYGSSTEQNSSDIWYPRQPDYLPSVFFSWSSNPITWSDYIAYFFFYESQDVTYTIEVEIIDYNTFDVIYFDSLTVELQAPTWPWVFCQPVFTRPNEPWTLQQISQSVANWTAVVGEYELGEPLPATGKYTLYLLADSGSKLQAFSTGVYVDDWQDEVDGRQVSDLDYDTEFSDNFVEGPFLHRHDTTLVSMVANTAYNVFLDLEGYELTCDTQGYSMWLISQEDYFIWPISTTPTPQLSPGFYRIAFWDPDEPVSDRTIVEFEFLFTRREYLDTPQTLPLGGHYIDGLSCGSLLPWVPAYPESALLPMPANSFSYFNNPQAKIYTDQWPHKALDANFRATGSPWYGSQIVSLNAIRWCPYTVSVFHAEPCLGAFQGTLNINYAAYKHLLIRFIPNNGYFEAEYVEPGIVGSVLYGLTNTIMLKVEYFSKSNPCTITRDWFFLNYYLPPTPTGPVLTFVPDFGLDHNTLYKYRLIHPDKTQVLLGMTSRDVTKDFTIGSTLVRTAGNDVDSTIKLTAWRPKTAGRIIIGNVEINGDRPNFRVAFYGKTELLNDDWSFLFIGLLDASTPLTFQVASEDVWDYGIPSSSYLSAGRWGLTISRPNPTSTSYQVRFISSLNLITIPLPINPFDGNWHLYDLAYERLSSTTKRVTLSIDNAEWMNHVLLVDDTTAPMQLVIGATSDFGTSQTSIFRLRTTFNQINLLNISHSANTNGTIDYFIEGVPAAYLNSVPLTIGNNDNISLALPNGTHTLQVVDEYGTLLDTWTVTIVGGTEVPGVTVTVSVYAAGRISRGYPCELNTCYPLNGLQTLSIDSVKPFTVVLFWDGSTSFITEPSHSLTMYPAGSYDFSFSTTGSGASIAFMPADYMVVGHCAFARREPQAETKRLYGKPGI